MRVFYDHQVTSLQDAGGISRYYFHLARALLQHEHVEPEMLLGLHRSVLPFKGLRPGVRVSSWRSPIRPGYARYALNEAVSTMLAPLRGRFDVYHTTYQRILPSVRARTIVATHHDSAPDRFPELFPDAKAVHARLKQVYARADRILCISESSRADLLQFFDVPPEKTVVVHHGFTPLVAEEQGTQSMLPLPVPPGPYLLYVGARAAYKNFNVVLRALAMHPRRELNLVVVGGGAWTGEERALIEGLGIGPRIAAMPPLSDRQLSSLYRKSAVLVYPSLYEGFGFPPLEAMDAGCPALVSRTSSLPEICGEAAFYFDPHDVEELSDWLVRLLADEGLRLSKRESGFAQVRKYSWEKCAEATLAVYGNS